MFRKRRQQRLVDEQVVCHIKRVRAIVLTVWLRRSETFLSLTCKFSATFITARKPSLRKGNVFTYVYHSVHRGGRAWQGGMRGGGGLWGSIRGREGVRGRRDGHCSGRYASCGNAFMFIHLFICPPQLETIENKFRNICNTTRIIRNTVQLLENTWKPQVVQCCLRHRQCLRFFCDDATFPPACS